MTNASNDEPGGSERHGVLVLAATPIGRVADASARQAQELATADVVAAEDTRRLRRLAADLGVVIGGRVVSHFEGNEAARAEDLVRTLLEGGRVLVGTDAGMPSVSDPGFTLVRAAIEAGVEVTSVPGPSAVTTALAVSGLPVDRFCFEGFLPRRGGERRSRLTGLAGEQRTMVFFESPHRLADALTDAVAAFGEARPAAVCRELTKTHEEVRRGTLGELAVWAQGEVRGEVTVVLAGAPEPSVELTPDELVRQVGVREQAGLTRKEALASVAAETGLPRREVYDAVVAAKHR